MCRGASAVNYFLQTRWKQGCIFTFFFASTEGRKQFFFFSPRRSAKCEAMSFSIARGKSRSGTTKMGLSVTHFYFSRYSSFHVFWAKVFRKSYFVMSVSKLHIVWKLLKMPHLNFGSFHHYFVLLKLTCLVTLFDRKLQLFKNSPKMNLFCHF